LSLTEAVMVLSTQLERSGHISRQAVRRRQSGLEADGMGDAVVLKLDSPTIRKAG